MKKLKKISMKNKSNGKTLEEGFNDFLLEHCQLKNLRPKTEKHYKELIQYSFNKFFDKDSLLADMQQKDINNYTLYLKKTNIKDTTVNIYLKSLKTIINYFKDKNLIDSNIKVNLIKTDIEEIEAYTDEEVAILLKKPNMKQCSFAEYRSWVVINFLCNTGCRRSTLINIHIEDLDLENGYCHYRHTKNRKQQTVPITVSMCNILKEYIEYLPEECIYLFPTVLGEQMKARSMSHCIDDYNKSRGVQRTGIHKFRHWFAKKSVLLGMDLMRLQKILGHSNLDILRNYVNLLTQDLKYDEVNLNPLEDINKKNRDKKYIPMKRRRK